MKNDTNERVVIYLAMLISICVSVSVYIWTSTSGKISSWASTTSYYDMLADAFLHGQTDLLVKPDPHLLTLPNPYDPVANMRYRLHDASLYRGKYYLYWGPVPGLLLTPVKWVRNAVSVSEDETWLTAVFHGRVRWVRNTVTVGDAYLVFAFAIGEVVFSALLLLALWRRYSMDRRGGVLFLAFWWQAWAHPCLTYLAARRFTKPRLLRGNIFWLEGPTGLLLLYRLGGSPPGAYSLLGYFGVQPLVHG